MKRLKVALLTGLAVAGLGTARVQSTRIGKHHIGESLHVWLTISQELDKLDSLCNSRAHGIQKQIDKSNCKLLQNVRDGLQNKVRTSDDNRGYDWKFAHGKLSEVTIEVPSVFAGTSARPSIQEELGFLIETYGKPTEQKTVPYQNSYSARWECAELSWRMPDGTQIVASEHIGNPGGIEGPRRELLVMFFSKEFLGRGGQQGRANPYQ